MEASRHTWRLRGRSMSDKRRLIGAEGLAHYSRALGCISTRDLILMSGVLAATAAAVEVIRHWHFS